MFKKTSEIGPGWFSKALVLFRDVFLYWSKRFEIASFQKLRTNEKAIGTKGLGISHIKKI
jgi:hypothetical protein